MRVYKLIVIIFSCLGVAVTVSAQNNSHMAELYAPYTELLDQYVIEGRTESGGLVSAFDYQSALSDPATADRVEKQKENLTKFNPKAIQNREQAVAFWINAYNFFMLGHILENPKPNGSLIDGVKDYGSFINPYWVFKQQIFNIGGKEYSLDTIEKDILLGKEYKNKGWKDARVHFAVNCASVGCPPLRKSLYLPDDIDSRLTENTRLALQTLRHLRFENGTLYLTQLFEWYENDFIEEAGSIRDFLKQYTPAETQQKIDTAKSIKFIDYDWALNNPSNFAEISRSTAREKPDNRD